MGYKSAILDTSVLMVLYHLNLLQYLHLFYNKVRIPREVEREFLEKNKNSIERSKRFEFLMNFYLKNKTWFIRCNEYNTDLVKIYLSVKGIDKGEAEAFAQNQAFGNIHEILLDEKQARKFANMENIQHHGVLFILANLDIKYGACNYFDAVKTAKNELKTFFSKKITIQVYNKIKGTS
ncbi:MAG: hypothetical protein U9R42_04305 [Bacteroidota bacterium]|nr:hypothetical protein [Bacteroidota bacterium]